MAYSGSLIPGCEHHDVDAWHAPTPEAAELVRRAATPYGWRDQLRAEMQGDVTKWMWPGLIILLIIGFVIRDYLIITVSLAALVFFSWQAYSVVRAMRRGKTIRAKCSRLELVHEGKKTKKGKVKGRVWHAHTRFEGRAQELMVVCPEFEKTLDEAGTVELLVLVDPDDSENNWLVGYRPLRGG